jgi:hypothetical protein
MHPLFASKKSREPAANNLVLMFAPIRKSCPVSMGNCADRLAGLVLMRFLGEAPERR